jgi:Excalibur calcium-binding domain
MTKLRAGLAAAAILAAPTALVVGSTDAASAASARTFQNCTALNKVYKHGVGLASARDRTSGTPVTSFKRSKALYLANKKSDRDKDGIACEKR